MNKSKGFTIIELIVVIAIIAILASIVLVNVTVYINKAKDAKIQSDLASIALGMGSCMSSGAGSPAGTYETCMANTTYVPATLTADINNSSTGGDLTYSSDTAIGAVSTTAYCASSKLASSGTTYTCVDSTGVTKTGTTENCASTLTACP